MLSNLGLIIALVGLIWLTLRGMNLLIAALLASLVVALTSYMPLIDMPGNDQASLTSNYMQGFSGFFTSWFITFMMGSIFGKLMADCGAADSISNWITSKFGVKKAALGVVVACAILTYGGVSAFIVAFSAYPIAVTLFKQANLPRRFIPACIGLGAITFTMTSAGSVEVQNWIPIQHLGTTPYAGWQVSIIVATFMAFTGYWWLMKMINNAVANGESFIERDNDPHPEDNKDLPSVWLSMLPLVCILAFTFFFHQSLQTTALLVALLLGCVVTYALNFKRFKHLGNVLGSGAMGALIATANTAAVVGFGTVVKASPAFANLLDALNYIPGSGLLAAATGVTLVAAVTGSATGGQAIALPVLGPKYLDMGVDPDALHRVVSISSGALDSLPHNGFVVTTIRAICGETHQNAYGPMAAVTLVVPTIGTVLAILLFQVM